MFALKVNLLLIFYRALSFYHFRFFFDYHFQRISFLDDHTYLEGTGIEKQFLILKISFIDRIIIESKLRTLEIYGFTLAVSLAFKSSADTISFAPSTSPALELLSFSLV